MALMNEALHGLGLEDKEIRIYTSLLELGEATVLTLSKKAGIKRPTAYIVLQSLEEKGLVTKTVRGKKSFFLAQHPKKLVSEAEFRLKELKEIVPQLETLFIGGTGKPRVTIYEGKERLDQSADEIFITMGEVVYMGTLKLSQEAFPRTFKKINEYATLSPEFMIRELIDESEENIGYKNRYRSQYRDIRFIPKELLPFEVDICVFGSRTLITSVTKEYFTISIESKEIAQSFKTLFEVMWKIAKE